MKCIWENEMIWAFPPGTPVLVTKFPKRAMYGTYLKKCIPPIPFPTPKQVVKKKIGIIHQDGCAHVFTKQIIWTYAWIWGFLAKNETNQACYFRFTKDNAFIHMVWLSTSLFFFSFRLISKHNFCDELIIVIVHTCLFLKF